MKKILLLFGVLFSVLGFSQTELTNRYQPPQTVADETVLMRDGFHANSNDGNYTDGKFFLAKTGDSSESTGAPVVHNPSLGENYIYSRTYLAPVTESNPYAPQMQSITYFDGLGRPKQNIAIKASPSGKDLVTPIVYDGFGRQHLDYLPVPVSTLNGSIQSTQGSDVNSYYSNSGLGGNAFSEKILENSPLDRVLEQYHPGEDWRTYSKRNVFEYLASKTSDEVRKYSFTTDWGSDLATTHTLPLYTLYSNNQLYKNVVKDEDNNETIEFKNGEGQTLLVRKVLSPTQNADTYYIYNAYNQLAFVFPPELSAMTSYDFTEINNLGYQYRYDGKGRLVEKRLPGKGWERMVYDRADRLILTQDAEMETPGKWLLTKYDKFGRVVYTGIVSGNDRSTEQNVIKNLVIVEEREDTTGFTRNNMEVFYTNHYYTHIESVLSVNYYDKYPPETFYPSGDAILGTPVLKDTYTSGMNRSTQSLPTASYVKNIENDQWTRNYIFYDHKGRTIGNYSINHLGGYTKTETELDFSGTPQRTLTYHKRLYGNPEVKIEETFSYDNQKRLLTHKHKVNNGQEEILAQNTYNELGQLTHKKVGNNIQEMKYSYNIRGWMTGINQGDILHNPGEETYSLINGKLFGYRIKYNNPDNETVAPKKFNGNISEVDWIFKDSSLRRYGYQYDSMNRLLNGIYQDPALAQPQTDINNESLEYDLNGNITRLYRNAKHGKFYTAIQIDDLSYTYTGNKVTNINDISGNMSGYEGGNELIEYDLNGNMTRMSDKGISAIVYNYLNLPKQINQHDNTINYYYRADGVKIKKKYTLVNASGTKIINTEYLDGFQYSTPNTDPIRRALEETDDATLSMATAGEEEAFSALVEREIVAAEPGNPESMILSFFPTAEGYYDYENMRYIYQYKDHLGNVRVSYVKDGNNLKEMDTNEYYPFGMSFIKSNTLTVYDPMAIPYNYKYQEQELQETGFYAFKWRQYMPDVGRFFNIDPLSEKFPYNSTYAFSENRVIDGRELEGLEHVPINFNSYANSFVPYLKDSAKSAIKSIGNTAEKVVNVLEDTGTYVKAGAIILGAGSVITGQPEGVATAVEMYNVGDKMSTAATVAKTTSLLSQGKVKDAAIGGAKEVVGGKVGDKINGLSKVNEVSKMVIKEGANNAIDKTATAIEKTVKPTENKPQKVVEDKKDPKN